MPAYNLTNCHITVGREERLQVVVVVLPQIKNLYFPHALSIRFVLLDPFNLDGLRSLGSFFPILSFAFGAQILVSFIIAISFFLALRMILHSLSPTHLLQNSYSHSTHSNPSPTSSLEYICSQTSQNRKQL